MQVQFSNVNDYSSFRLKRKRAELGFSLVELMVVLCLIGILSGLVIYNSKLLDSPIQNSITTTSRFIGLARARAISSTQSVKVRPTTNRSLAAYAGPKCTGPMTVVSDLKLELASDTVFTEVGWEICIDSRGFLKESAEVQIDDGHLTKTVKVSLGGGVKIE